MTRLPGTYPMTDKNGSSYYKASITYLGKHISLGSFNSAMAAHKAYLYASDLLNDKIDASYDSHPSNCPIPFDKWIVLINFRDHKLYFKTPIYLMQSYFFYYIDEATPLKFDVDDLFYYSKHTITKRGGHLFISEYGMQVNIMSRYGIKNYAVCGRDFLFVNGDTLDFRYHNIEVINRYHGVFKESKNNRILYLAKIHIHGDFIIGRYSSDIEAAVAYNKAVHILQNHGIKKNFPENFIDELDEISYSKLYAKVHVSRKVRDYK